MQEDKTLANILKDETISNVLNDFARGDFLTDQFLEIISQPVYLKFNNTSLTIFFEGPFLTSPIPEFPYTDAEGHFCICKDIGFAFTTFYHLLNDNSKVLLDFKLRKNQLDDVYNLRSDLRLLKAAIFSLDNAAKTPGTLMDELSLFTTSRLGSIYGDRTVQETNEDGSAHALERYINCDNPDYKGFVDYLQNEMEYAYHCKNLYQICGAILDYLCRYKRYDNFATKPYTLSLRKCPRCGRYFVTEDRKIMYCHYTDMDGKTCADWQEADRKKLLAQTPKSEAEQLAEKIRRRLYSYRTNVKTSRYDCTDDLRFEERDKLYKLYTKCRKEQSQSPHFSEWITECAAQLPKSRSESYDKFYEWLLERST